MSRAEGAFSIETMPAGAWLTMPAKMMKLMPLPMPFSVMSSPSHIRTTAPATRVIICTQLIALPRPKLLPMITSCAVSSGPDAKRLGAPSDSQVA